MSYTCHTVENGKAIGGFVSFSIGLVLVFTLWACSVENLWKEHRQREPLCHMTTEVNVHAEKEEEKRNNLFDTFFLSVSSLSFSHTHSPPPSAAFFFSMEAMRRKQVWSLLEANKGVDMLAFYSPLLGKWLDLDLRRYLVFPPQFCHTEVAIIFPSSCWVMLFQGFPDVFSKHLLLLVLLLGQSLFQKTWSNVVLCLRSSPPSK